MPKIRIETVGDIHKTFIKSVDIVAVYVIEKSKKDDVIQIFTKRNMYLENKFEGILRT